MINQENYEEFLCSYVDGELKEAQIKELFQFLEAHPELKEELAVFEATKLQPDLSLVFESKNVLQKNEGAVVISLFNWKTLSAAAGIALLLGFSWTLWKDDTASNSQQPIVQQETPSTQPNDSIQPTPKHETILIVKEKKKHIMLPQQEKVKEVEIFVLQHEEIAAISQKDFNDQALLPVFENKQALSLIAVNTTTFNNNILLEADKKNLMDLLNYDNEKQTSIHEVTQVFASTIEQAKSFSQNLKETTFAFRFGGKDYLLNH